MQQLTQLLARERLLLDVVLFRAVELRQLMTAGEGRYLHWASDELEKAVGAVREAELLRCVRISEIAAELRVSPDDVTLTMLADRADEPWATMLREHRQQLRKLSAEIDDVLGACGRLAASGSQAVAAVLDKLSGSPNRSRVLAAAGAPAGPAAASVYGPGARWDHGRADAYVSRTL